MGCRFCGDKADHVFVDLGMSPLCESYPDGGAVEPDGAVLSVAGARLSPCFLVQLAEYVSPEHIFSDTRTSRRIRAAGSSTPARIRR